MRNSRNPAYPVYAFEVSTARRTSQFISSQGKPLQPACRWAPNEINQILVLLLPAPAPQQEPLEKENPATPETDSDVSQDHRLPRQEAMLLLGKPRYLILSESH